MKPFLIIGLPRSMTAWIANWFTTDKSICFHEGAVRYGDLHDLIQLNKFDLNLFFGDSSSGLNPVWCSQLIELQNFFNIGYVHRDSEACLASYDKVNQIPNKVSSELTISLGNKYLQYVLSAVNYVHIEYEDLLDETKFKKFHMCIAPSVAFSSTRYKILRDLRVTQKVKEVYERDYA